MMLLCHSLRYLPVGTRKTFVRLVHQEHHSSFHARSQTVHTVQDVFP